MTNLAPTIELSKEERKRLRAFFESRPSRHYALEIKLRNESVFRSLREHLLFGQRGGGFVEKLLRNRFAETTLKADNRMREVLPELATYLHNMPMNAWGTEEAIRNWRETGGLYSDHSLEEAIEILHRKGL